MRRAFMCRGGGAGAKLGSSVALALSLGCLISLLIAVSCILAVCVDRYYWIDAIFPYIVLLLPITIVCVSLAPIVAGVTLILSAWSLCKWQRLCCWLAIASSGLIIALFTVVLPTRATPPVPDDVSRERTLSTARRMLAQLPHSNLSMLHNGKYKLSKHDRVKIKTAAAIYRSIANARFDPDATHKLAQCEVLLGNFPKMMMLQGNGLPLRYVCKTPHGVNISYISYSEAIRHDSMGYAFEAMSLRIPPREIFTRLANNRELCDGLIDADEAQTDWQFRDKASMDRLNAALATPHAFAAHGRWREAAWLLEAALSNSDWILLGSDSSNPFYRTSPTLASAFAFLAHCYERWAKVDSARSHILKERAAKTLARAASCDGERAAEFHARAAQQFLEAGAPLRALVELREAKDLTKSQTLPRKYASMLRRAESLVEQTSGKKLREQHINDHAHVMDQIESASRSDERIYAVQLERFARLFRAEETLLDDIDFVLAREFETTWEYTRYRKRVRRGTIWVEETIAPPSKAVRLLEQVLNRAPDCDMAAEAEAELARIRFSKNSVRRIDALADALIRYPDHPGTGLLLRKLRDAIAEAVSRGEFFESRIHVTNPELRDAILNTAIFHQGSVLMRDREWLGAATMFSQVHIHAGNLWLSGLIDATLANERGPICFAPYYAGRCYLAAGRVSEAIQQFRRVVAHPDLYSGHDSARVVIAICELSRGNYLGALDHLHKVDSEGIGSLQYDDLICVLFTVFIPESALKTDALAFEALGYGRERLWALSLHRQHARDFPGLVHTIEDYVLKYPDHPEAKSLFDRLCAVERSPLPNAQRSRRADTWTANVNSSKGVIEQVSSAILKRLSEAAISANFDGSCIFDNAVFESRSYPALFRLRRTMHRALNRLIWNAQMRLKYRSAPSQETSQFDLALWFYENPFGTTSYPNDQIEVGVAEPFTDVNGNHIYDVLEPYVDLNGNGVWDNYSLEHLHDLHRLVPERQARIIDLIELSEGPILAGGLLEQFAKDHPGSDLRKRALHLAVCSRAKWTEKLSLANCNTCSRMFPDRGRLIRRRAHEALTRARTDFVTLATEFPKYEETDAAAFIYGNMLSGELISQMYRDDPAPIIALQQAFFFYPNE